MKFIPIVSLLVFIQLTSKAQLYFPPSGTTTWDTIVSSNLGWCQNKIDSLYDFLNSKNSKAFILLKDGKIVLEKYFGTHTPSSVWYWASAGKTLTAMAVGIAQQESYLNIHDTTSSYLGNGWTSMPLSQEQKITIKHQLSMTTGLDDGVPDPYCTLSSCLVYKADTASRWAYHNAPYTLLDSVIEMATGQTLNAYVTQKIKTPTGMDGLFIPSGYNNTFYSTARSMARYGLLLLNKGVWNTTPILTDTAYFHAMTNSSQSLNPSYGYLTWLNGKSSYMIPQSQLSFTGPLNPHAPSDMFAAMGKNAQFIDVVPSQNLVWIRMGDAPDSSQVPFLLNDAIWEKINQLSCFPIAVSEQQSDKNITLFPNPAKQFIQLQIPNPIATTLYKYSIHDVFGRSILSGTMHSSNTTIEVDDLENGVYFIEVSSDEKRSCMKFIVQH